MKPEDIYVRTYTPTEIADIAKDKNFSWVVTIVERYMEQPLSPSDVELIVYLYDNLKFSPDLIFHLYEYCISRRQKDKPLYPDSCHRLGKEQCRHSRKSKTVYNPL